VISQTARIPNSQDTQTAMYWNIHKQHWDKNIHWDLPDGSGFETHMDIMSFPREQILIPRTNLTPTQLCIIETFDKTYNDICVPATNAVLEALHALDMLPDDECYRFETATGTMFECDVASCIYLEDIYAAINSLKYNNNIPYVVYIYTGLAKLCFRLADVIREFIKSVETLCSIEEEDDDWDTNLVGCMNLLNVGGAAVTGAMNACTNLESMCNSNPDAVHGFIFRIQYAIGCVWSERDYMKR
jgi:hypothetical protein